MFLPLKKKIWKVLPLYNVVGQCFTEEFWPPVSSHVSVSPFLCLQQPFVFVLKATTFLQPRHKSDHSLGLSRPRTPLLWFGSQEISHVNSWNFGLDQTEKAKLNRSGVKANGWISYTFEITVSCHFNHSEYFR